MEGIKGKINLLDASLSINQRRYFCQEAIFGSPLQSRLAGLKVLLVGAGAIGCEMLKNLALMGVGNIVVTDPDHIERSNLSRQFLFRPDDIGGSKAETAAKAAMVMNPQVKIEPLRLK